MTFSTYLENTRGYALKIINFNLLLNIIKLLLKILMIKKHISYMNKDVIIKSIAQ